MTGRVTTHVLDIIQGRPAVGMRIELWQLGRDGSRSLLTTVQTNHDGRVGSPLLSGAGMICGLYELVFDVDGYFRSQLMELPDPPFLERVPVRFGIFDPKAHYHVPLLISPWSYSTYRGS